MSMNTKDLHKVCGKLREERFITMLVVVTYSAEMDQKLITCQTHKAGAAAW